MQADRVGDYGRWLGRIRVTENEAADANRERAEQLASLLGRGIVVECSGKKLYSGNLSPGCRACARGRWSCLFLTVECTADCFFCPQRRSEPPVARANRLDFPNLTAYLDFLALTKMEGVAFSGGEPLLVQEKVLAWIGAIRRRFGDGIYLWLYSNGDLADEATLRALVRAGLDEIRLNIAVRQYDLTPVALARQVIPRVSVEVPVIPEEIDLLRGCLKELGRLNVDYLNLHQLYANEQNYQALAQRDYRFLTTSLEAPVWESELGALALMHTALEGEIALPVHYCSVDYQVTFQDAAARRMAARALSRDGEQITATGHIRRLKVQAPGESRNRLIESLAQWREPGDGWFLDDGELIVHPELLALPELAPYPISVVYLDAELLPAGGPVLDIYERWERVEVNESFHLLAGAWRASEMRDLAARQAWSALHGQQEEPGGQMARYERIPYGPAPIVPRVGRARSRGRPSCPVSRDQ